MEPQLITLQHVLCGLAAAKKNIAGTREHGQKP